MGLINTLADKFSHPVKTAFAIAAKIDPHSVFNNYSKLAEKQGVRKIHFILSFDCDTERDFSVIQELHKKLSDSGIMPVYAVPGQLLEKGRTIFEEIASTGAEFINHGYKMHATYNEQSCKYDSFYFYDTLTQNQIRDDIRHGQESIIKIIGKNPQGFRVPHFGTFQRPRQIRFLHRFLYESGYLFSTSGTPYYGLRNGPVKKIFNNFYEIPLSGCYDFPFTVLDSWNFRYAPGRVVNEHEYEIQFKKMVEYFSYNSIPCILNYYVDPSQVFDWPYFFNCMRLAAQFAVPSYESLLKNIN